MRVLTARWPNGKLASLTCDTPGGFGERFRASFELRGFIVHSFTREEYEADEQRRRQEREVVVSPLPEIGQAIRHHQHGAGVVAYLLTTPEGPLAVARGAGWEGVLRPGGWSVVTAELVATEAEPLRAEPVPEVLSLPASLGPWTMPSLFEALP